MSNDEIKDLFETLGVTRRYIGYYFLLDAVEIVNRDETTLLKVGEYIYEPIAKSATATLQPLKEIYERLFCIFGKTTRDK